MDKQTYDKYAARANILKAMAHPSRLFIVDELFKGEKCVCEITQMLDFDISTVSKHLLVLKNAGIIEDEKRGLQVFYRLKCKCSQQFLNCCEIVIKSNAEKQASLVLSE